MVEIIKSLVRPFISVAFVLSTVTMFLMGKEVPTEMLTTTGMIVAFHFGERATKNGRANNQ